MQKDPMVQALIALCNREGSYKDVAAIARVSPDNLWQIVSGTKLPSGNPRGVGPSLRKKITDAFPNWLATGQGTPDTLPAQLPGSGDGALDAVATAALVAELARRIKKIPRDQRSFMAQEAAALVMSPDSEETRAALAHYLQFGDERLPTTTTQLHDREPHATEPTAHKGNVRS